MGKLQGKGMSLASLFGFVRSLQIVPVTLGLAIASLIIFAVVLNLSPDAPRGEPVLRLSLERAAPLGPTVTSEAPREAAGFELRDSLDKNGQSSAPAFAENPAGDTIIIRRTDAGAQLAAGVSPPMPQLMQSSSVGPLPVIAEDGLRPMDAYARPVAASTAAGAPARIALIVGGLGLTANLTAEALRIRPAETSLAFAPYGRNLEYWTEKARTDGHEYFLQMPMEPFDYPDNDPGPHTLLTSLRAGENIQRKRWVMGRITGYAGIINFKGAKFTASESHTIGMLKEAQTRGLLFIDDGTSPRSLAPRLAQSIGHESLVVDVTIDADPRPEAIGQALARLESIAQERGFAVGSASILPISLSSLSSWVEQLENRGIVLVPATSLAVRGTARPSL